MARFIEKPDIRWVGTEHPDYHWLLRTRCVYQSDVINDIIIVPAGYRTDLASVPRLPFVYMVTGGRANMAAIVHDWLYDCCTGYVTRKQADQVFLEAMRVMNEPRRAITRWTMYTGVRVGGWRGWRRDSTHKCRACNNDEQRREAQRKQREA